jgi:rare lipoprotein A
MAFPNSGKASTYSDFFINKPTASGDFYQHDKYTAALLPRSNWGALPMGTLLQLTHKGRKVVVKVNDKGAGKTVKDPNTGVRTSIDDGRVLDLSRIAWAYLSGKEMKDVSDATAGIILLETIIVVPYATPLGPVQL